MATQTLEIRAVDKTQGALRNINKRLKDVQGSLISVNQVAGLAVAALGAIGGAGLIKNIVNTSRSFEVLRAQLKTVTGSAELASVAFSEIQKFASTTPFTVDEITQSFVILKRNGIDATTDSLRAFGNIAAANNKTFTQFGEAVADALVGEFERLKEFGIKVRRENGKFAVALGNQQLAVVDSSEQVIETIKKLGEEGGRFSTGIADRAATLDGALSNLKDSSDAFATAIGEGGLNDALRDSVGFLSQILQRAIPLAQEIGDNLGFAVFKTTKFFKEMNFDIEKLIMGTKIAIAVLGGAGLVKALQMVTNGVKAMTLAMARNPIGLLAVAAASVITFLSMENGLGRTIAQVSAVMNKMGEVFAAVGTFLKDSFAKIVEKITGAFDFLVNSVIDGINAVAEFLGFQKIIKTSSSELREEIKDLAVEGFNAVSLAVDDTVETIKDYISTSELVQKANEAGTSLLHELKQAYIDAGLSHDEANKIAREQFDQLKQTNALTRDYGEITLPKVNEAMGVNTDKTKQNTKETEKQRKEREKLQAVFKNTSFATLQKDLVNLRKAYDMALDDQRSFLDDSVDIDNQFYTNKELLEQEFQGRRFEIIKKFEDRIKELQMRNIRQALGENENATSRALTLKEKEFLQRRGFEERNAEIINDRIEFEKKSELEKTQFGISQGKKFFEALGSQNKKFFAAMKAFAIAEAIINTYQGATKALATYPPPFNFIAAAATVAAGLAQVATIRSQQPVGAQRGGALRAGQSAVVGEDGPELIVPKQPSTVIPREVAEAIDGIGGRSQPVTVNFNINTVDARDFDDLLVERRATITGIINNAMRQQGRMGVV